MHQRGRTSGRMTKEPEGKNVLHDTNLQGLKPHLQLGVEETGLISIQQSGKTGGEQGVNMSSGKSGLNSGWTLAPGDKTWMWRGEGQKPGRKFKPKGLS